MDKEDLINEFNVAFPKYELRASDDEGFDLYRKDAISTEEGIEPVWIATVFEMAELFVLFEYNRRIVNDRNEL